MAKSSSKVSAKRRPTTRTKNPKSIFLSPKEVLEQKVAQLQGSVHDLLEDSRLRRSQIQDHQRYIVNVQHELQTVTNDLRTDGQRLPLSTISGCEL